DRLREQRGLDVAAGRVRGREEVEHDRPVAQRVGQRILEGLARQPRGRGEVRCRIAWLQGGLGLERAGGRQRQDGEHEAVLERVHGRTPQDDAVYGGTQTSRRASFFRCIF